MLFCIISNSIKICLFFCGSFVGYLNLLKSVGIYNFFEIFLLVNAIIVRGGFSSLLPSFNSNLELYLEDSQIIKVQHFSCFGSPNLFQVRVIKVIKEKKHNNP